MGQGSEGKTIAEEVPESVELREIGLSFALPMGKSISRTLTRELRTQLQTLASQTADLAGSGDTAARDVVDYMHRAGVTMTPSSQAQVPSPPSS